MVILMVWVAIESVSEDELCKQKAWKMCSYNCTVINALTISATDSSATYLYAATQSHAQVRRIDACNHVELHVLATDTVYTAMCNI